MHAALGRTCFIDFVVGMAAAIAPGQEDAVKALVEGTWAQCVGTSARRLLIGGAVAAAADAGAAALLVDALRSAGLPGVPRRA